MRLEKHTDEEIELAKEESGDATPSKEELEEWKIVHNKMNADLVRKANEQLGCQIISLQGVILPYLEGRARRIAQTGGTSTVLELLRNEKTGVCFPWYQSGLLGSEYVTREALDGAGTFAVTTVLCQFLTKQIEIDKGDNDKLEYWVKRLAATFTKLADAEKIKYGILAPFMILPLANLDAEGAGESVLRLAMESGARLSPEKIAEVQAIKDKITDECPTRRLLLMVYPYTHFEREELNEWLGNEAFVEEGALGTTDWDGLPDVS